MPIDKRLKSKIEVYSTLIPILLGYKYAKMMDLPHSYRAKKQITIISALMPINDEFVDRLGHDKEYIDSFFRDVDKRQVKDQHERVQKKAAQYHS